MQLLAESTWQTPAWALLVLLVVVAANFAVTAYTLLVRRSESNDDRARKAEADVTNAKLDAVKVLCEGIARDQAKLDADIRDVRAIIARRDLQYERRFSIIEGRLGIGRGDDERRNGGGRPG